MFLNHRCQTNVYIAMKKIATLLLCTVAIFLIWQGSSSCSTKADAEPVSATSSAKSATKSVRADAAHFEKAVEIIKKYEGLHQPKHWPLVGYGHMVLKGEKFNRSKTMSEKEADALLRKDLLKNCAVFREFGKDSLLLGVLAYNIGSGNVKRSTVVSKLRQGDRNIRENFIAHCRYKGKQNPQIKRRRIEEFETLFLTDKDSTKLAIIP